MQPSAPEPAPGAPLTEAAREALILDHLPLLHHIVGRMVVDLPSRVDRDDLLGWGMLGLVGAADAWDASRGLQFSTFAYPRIRGAILDELRRLDFLPRGRRDRVRELDRTLSKLEQRLGAPPSPEQLAEELGCALEEVDALFQTARSAATVSLDDGPSEALASLLADPTCEDPVGSAEWEELKALLVGAIEALPDVERTVITLYYGEGLLLREIGAVLDVTESRVSQLHGRALYRLNRGLRAAIGQEG